ncbi:MAG: hypothetical protein KatS3mg068_1625 [Candidatus Sericytochromatia bacterium]|nr:MAG: hypothetical protein KatS3mg068_1625 [Candidatus Sericytochromatia bacterium]
MEEDKIITIETKKIIKNLIDFLNHFLNKKIKIIRNTIIVALLSAIILLIIPNQFTATVSFIPPTPESLQAYSSDLNLSLQENLPNFVPKIGGGLFGKEPYNLYIQILNSRKINEKIIRKFNLMEKYNKEYIEDMLRLLDKIVEKNVADGVLYIQVTTDEPELSSKIAKEYLLLLSNQLNDFNIESAKNSKEFLEKRLKEVKEELDIASKRLTNFQVQNKMIDLDKQGQAIISEIAELQSNIIKSEAELQGLSKIYTDNNLKVQSLKASISSLKGRLSKLISKNNIYTTVKNNSNTEFTVNLLDIPSFAVDYVNLSRNVKILEQVFILLTKEYELSKLKESKEKVVLKVLDDGQVPTKKSKPPKTLILFLILFLFIFFYFLYESFMFFIEKIKNEDKETYDLIIDTKKKIFSSKP